MKAKRQDTKIIGEYTDRGFGFPVLIRDVPVVSFHGEEVALIDYEKLESLLLRAVPERQSPLLGAEIRFIRQHYGLTLEQFGRLFGVTHAAVKKWEDHGEKPARMSRTTEMAVRLWVQYQEAHGAKAFVKTYERMMRGTSDSRQAGPPTFPYAQVASASTSTRRRSNPAV